MDLTPLPLDEAERLQALRRLDLLTGRHGQGGRFKRITEIAKRLFNVMAASFTLVDQDEQSHRYSAGFPLGASPCDAGLCNRVVQSGDRLVVESMLADPEFAENPLVTGDMQVRFYAGHPIREKHGYIIGTLCLLDDKERTFSEEDQETLRDLANWIELLLMSRDLSAEQKALVAGIEEAERASLTDALTRIPNRRAADDFLRSAVNTARRSGSQLIVGMVDLDHFKRVNDTYGHPVGDAVLKEVAKRLQATLRKGDMVARYGGEEFILVMPDASSSILPRLRTQFCDAVRSLPVVWDGGAIHVTTSVGLVLGDFSAGDWDSDDLQLEADKALYRAKEEGRDRTEIVVLVQH